MGLIKVRSFRPFPAEDICEALKNVKAFAVMDKDDSFNAHCGPMYAEVTASLYAAGISGPKGISYIYGLGAGTCGWRASSMCSRSWSRSPPPAKPAIPTGIWMSGNKEGVKS